VTSVGRLFKTGLSKLFHLCCWSD